MYACTDKKFVTKSYLDHSKWKKKFCLMTFQGNGRFCIRNAINLTTMEILIDGPYLTHDLIDRIKDNDFLKELLQEEINCDDNSAIFFIYSQGISDEQVKVKL